MKKVLSMFFIFIFVLTSSISVFATESSFVTNNDGRSYDGLPPFPTISGLPKTGGLMSLFYRVADYTLFEKDGQYLLHAYPVSLPLYLSGNYMKQQTDSSIKPFYLDEALTKKVDSSYVIVRYGTFKLIDGEWVFDSLRGDITPLDGYNIVSSTLDIYKDSTQTTVFFKSETTPKVSGMSPTEIKKITLSQMVGLIPLVIGLLVVLIAFYKGWAFLRRLLKTA